MKYFSHFLLIAIAVFALGLRVYQLSDRPMHTDEAVQAAKFGALLDKGEYKYDPYEYHGPSLNYFTLLPAWISGTDSYVDTSETLLRSVPLFFGMALVLLSLFFFNGNNRTMALIMVALLSVSPAMVFYSRYYIHEMLLVFFTYSAIFTYFKASASKKPFYMALFGFSIGMMVITKETWVLSIAAMGLAYLILKQWNSVPQPGLRGWVTGGVIMSVIIVLFFSSFFSHPRGLIDMVLTYSNYLNRAGTSDLHLHPWYYYPMLLIYRSGEGLVWSELPILIFSAIGYYFLFRKEGDTPYLGMLRFIALFCLLLLVIYSVLPYKTPWNLLNFYYGMILIAGFGAYWLIRSFSHAIPKILISLILVAAGLYFLVQNLAEYKQPANPDNPYVYGHTHGDFHTVIATIDSATVGRNTFIEVIFPGHDYWPLPWYLRKYRRVAYRDQVDFDEPSGEIILIAPQLEGPLVEKLYERPAPGERNLYVGLFDTPRELRHSIYFYGYMQQDLWIRRQNEIYGGGSK